jgi:hypothetical protein
MSGKPTAPLPAFGASAGAQGSGTFAAICSQLSPPTTGSIPPPAIAAGSISSTASFGKTVPAGTPNAKDSVRNQPSAPAKAALFVLLVAPLPVIPDTAPLMDSQPDPSACGISGRDAPISSAAASSPSAANASSSVISPSPSDLSPARGSGALSPQILSFDPSPLLQHAVQQAAADPGAHVTPAVAVPSSAQISASATVVQPPSLWTTQVPPSQGDSQLNATTQPQSPISTAVGDSAEPVRDNLRSDNLTQVGPVPGPLANTVLPAASTNFLVPAFNPAPDASTIAPAPIGNAPLPDATTALANSGNWVAPKEGVTAEKTTSAQTSPTPAAPSSELPQANALQPPSLPHEVSRGAAIPSSATGAQAPHSPPTVTPDAPNNRPSSNILEAIRTGLHPLLNDALKSLAGDLLQGLSSGSPRTGLSPSRVPSTQSVIPSASSDVSSYSATPALHFSGEALPVAASGNPASPPGGAVAATVKQSRPPDTTSPASPDASLHKNPATPAAFVTPSPAQVPVTQASAAPLVYPAIQSAAGQTDVSLPTHKPDGGSSTNVPGALANPPAAPELPAAPPIGPVQIAQMVSKAAQSEMRIGMTTSAFGNVEVRTVVHANDVGVLIGSEKGDLRMLLANELPAIANTLQQQNLRLHEVNFHQGSALSDNQHPGGNSQPRSFAFKPIPGMAGRREALNPEPGETAGPSRVRLGSGLSVLA